jgi:hypothetical protein
VQVKEVYRNPLPFQGWHGFEPGLNLSFEYGEQYEWDLDELEEDQQSRCFKVQGLQMIWYENRDLRNARANQHLRRCLLKRWFRVFKTKDSKNVLIGSVDWDDQEKRTVTIPFVSNSKQLICKLQQGLLGYECDDSNQQVPKTKKKRVTFAPFINIKPAYRYQQGFRGWFGSAAGWTLSGEYGMELQQSLDQQQQLQESRSFRNSSSRATLISDEQFDKLYQSSLTYGVLVVDWDKERKVNHKLFERSQY